MALEDHDPGRQFVRFRAWPRLSPKGIALTLLFAALFTGAALDHAWVAGAIFCAVFLLLAIFTLEECAAATGSILRALLMVEERATASAAAAQAQQVTEPVEALPSRVRGAAVGTRLDKPRNERKRSPVYQRYEKQVPGHHVQNSRARLTASRLSRKKPTPA